MGRLITLTVFVALGVVFWRWWWKRQDIAKKASTYRLLNIPLIIWCLFMFYLFAGTDEGRILFNSARATVVFFYALMVMFTWVMMGMGVHAWLNFYPKFAAENDENEETPPEPESENLDDRINKMIDDSKR